MESERVARIRPYLCASNNAVIDAHARRIAANCRLVRAVGKRFDDVDWEALQADYHIFLPQDFAFAVAGEWDVADNRATIAPGNRMGGADQLPPPPLTKVGGAWKIDVSDPEATNEQQLLVALDQYAKVLDGTSDDVESGRAKSVDAIRDSLAKAPHLDSAGYFPDIVLTLARASAPKPAGPKRR